MGTLAKELAQAFLDGCKVGPRLFFAPLTGAIKGASRAIKTEINRPSPSDIKVKPSAETRQAPEHKKAS